MGTKRNIISEIHDILFENVIGQFQDKIDVVYAIDKTKHAEERQQRHGDSQITDEKITEVVKLGIDELAKALIFDKIDIGDRVWIYDSLTNLNIVAVTKQDGERIKFII